MASMLHLVIFPIQQKLSEMSLFRLILVTVSAIICCTAAQAAPLSYADIADLVTPAPIIAKVQPKKVQLLKPEEAGAPAAGYSRALIVAKTIDPIRSPGSLPPVISYLVDLPNRPDGRRASPSKSVQLIFARPAARADFVQLVSKVGQLPWSPELEAQVRPVVAEATQPDAAPIASGIGEAFFNRGEIEGASESQIFLTTRGGSPISLSIVRRPDSEPRWWVSVGEVVNEAAPLPVRNTLLWYSLACGLPATLPDESTRTLPLQDAETVRRDYQFVREALGSCGRTL